MIVTLDTRIYPLECIRETIEAFQKLVSVEVGNHCPNKVSLTYSCYDGNLEILKDEFLNYLLTVASVRL